MAETIQGLFIDPPIAIARLGGSTVPQDAYTWHDSENPRTDGQTTITPRWSLDVRSDGSVEPRLPSTIQLRDGELIRPVAPFLEIWALMGAAGSAPSTWREVPVTPALLRQLKTNETAITVSVDARNRKAARRTGNADLTFGTFPAVELRGDAHAPVTLLGVTPPRVAKPMIPSGRSIPLGSVQILRSRTQPPAKTVAWAGDVDVETIRLRFTPARGRFYGPPVAAQEVRGRPAAIDTANAFLNPAAGWLNQASLDVVEPNDTYDAVRENSNASLGVVDDTCEARIEVRLTLPGRAPRVLSAHANIFVAPPDFAPDRRPFLSLADEINDRGADAKARNAGMTADKQERWVEDLFARIYETVSLLNVDCYRDENGIRLTGDQVAPTPIPGDSVPQPNRSMGGSDGLRNRDEAIGGPTAVEPLPLSVRARTRHRSLADIDALRDFVVEHAGRLKSLIRPPFWIDRGESGSPGVSTTMRMPPFMRQSNGFPLSLSSWQYELLMSWVSAAEAAPKSPVMAVARRATRPISDAAAVRRAAILTRLDRPGTGPRS